jgi:hypothetical protein
MGGRALFPSQIVGTEMVVVMYYLDVNRRRQNEERVEKDIIKTNEE